MQKIAASRAHARTYHATSSVPTVSNPGAKYSFYNRNAPVLARPDSCQGFKSDRSVQCHASLQLLDVAVSGTPLLHTVCHTAATCVIIAACVRNVPQILRCWRAQSADGISVASLFTEISCYAALVAYATRSSYAVTIWGSDVACWLQDSVLLALVARLRSFPLVPTLAVAAVWFAAQAFLFSDKAPVWLLSKIQVAGGVILGLGARMPQILLNHRNGHTGNLAAATFAFNCCANAVNGLCALVLTGDVLVIATQLWMFALNATLVAQIAASDRRLTAEAAKAAEGQRAVVSRFSYAEFETLAERSTRPGYA